MEQLQMGGADDLEDLFGNSDSPAQGAVTISTVLFCAHHAIMHDALQAGLNLVPLGTSKRNTIRVQYCAEFLKGDYRFIDHKARMRVESEVCLSHSHCKGRAPVLRKPTPCSLRARPLPFSSAHLQHLQGQREAGTHKGQWQEEACSDRRAHFNPDNPNSSTLV